jgi:hypothetical protein
LVPLAQERNADEANAILERRLDIRLHGHTDARVDGRPQAGAIHPGKVAADKLVATSGQVAIQDGDLPEGGVFVGKAYTAAIISAALRDLAGLT